MAEPITVAEVEAAIKLSNPKGAPGPDGLKLSHVKALGSVELACHFNLWLLAGEPLGRLRQGRTTLIPKKAVADEPGDYRPITVTSQLGKLFHKILANCLETSLPLSYRQKAFRSGDGIAANILLLQSIIRDAKKNRKPLTLSFLDVAKAFDSVSQESIKIAMNRLGVPSIVAKYIIESYCNPTTLVCGQSVKQNREVKQGDPLSPILFNAVIDKALRELDSTIGIDLGGEKFNHLAFADDVVLLAKFPESLRILAQQNEAALLKCGLHLNAKKSATMNIMIDDKHKRWISNPLPFLILGGVGVPSMSAESVYKYLGTSMSAFFKDKSIPSAFDDSLSHLRRAPLKPNQRLFILKTFFVLKFCHVLSLEQHLAGFL